MRANSHFFKKTKTICTQTLIQGTLVLLNVRSSLSLLIPARQRCANRTFFFLHTCTVGRKSHDPFSHKKCMEAEVMAFVAHCTFEMHSLSVFRVFFSSFVQHVKYWLYLSNKYICDTDNRALLIYRLQSYLLKLQSYLSPSLLFCHQYNFF